MIPFRDENPTLAAAALQIAVQPASPVPMVVHVLLPIFFFFTVIRVPAYLMLLWWSGLQLLAAAPQLNTVAPDVSSGVAVFAHIGGFACGAVLVKLFARRTRVEERQALRLRHA